VAGRLRCLRAPTGWRAGFGTVGGQLLRAQTSLTHVDGIRCSRALWRRQSGRRVPGGEERKWRRWMMGEQRCVHGALGSGSEELVAGFQLLFAVGTPKSLQVQFSTVPTLTSSLVEFKLHQTEVCSSVCSYAVMLCAVIVQ